AVMRLNDLPHNREPEPAALRASRARAIDLIKPLEDSPNAVWRNVRAGVMDVDGNPPRGSAAVGMLIAGAGGSDVGRVLSKLDRSSGRSVSNWIVEQVDEHLL